MLNEAVEKSMNEVVFFNLKQMWHNSLFNDNGPLWYRGYGLESEITVCKLLDEALKDLKASRMIIGHTVTNGMIIPRCNNKVYCIDVGISRVYGGHSAAIEIIGSTVTAIYPNSRKIMEK
jgi:hypothetical protein